MFQSFLKVVRRHEPVDLGMSDGFVHVIKVDVLVLVILVQRLQTGDVFKKGRSRQAAKNDYGMFAFGAGKFEFLSVFVKC